MNSSAFVMGILPLIAFVLMDTFFGLKSGLIAAVIFALVELVYTLVKFGSVDMVTGLSIFLVVIMSFFAWKKNSEKLFLLQPVIMSVFLGSYFLFTYFIHEPIILQIFDKYGPEFIPHVQMVRMNKPIVRELMTMATLTSGIAFFFHALATWFAGFKLNKWWWVAARGIGFYLFMSLGFFGARFLL